MFTFLKFHHVERHFFKIVTSPIVSVMSQQLVLKLESSILDQTVENMINHVITIFGKHGVQTYINK